MIKPLPLTAGKLQVEYKLYGPAVRGTVWLTAKNIGNKLTFEGSEEGQTPDDMYEQPWKIAEADLTEDIKEAGWAQTFGSNDWLQIQVHDMKPLNEDGEGNMLWVKSVKWINSNKGESGVAELGVAERPADNRVFNMMGVEVKGELAPGLYIRNGKKFIVK